MSVASVTPITPQPRPEPGNERFARFLAAHGVTPECLRLSAEATPRLAARFLLAAQTMDMLTAT